MPFKSIALRRHLTAFSILLCSGISSFAHREDYLDKTLVYMTLSQGEVEPEYWFDYGHRSDEKRYFARHHAVLEYGITERWMIEGGATFEKEMGRAFKFGSALIETRYRFAEEGEWPVDLAVSLEGEYEKEDDDELFLIEPRLILSRDIGKLNFTLNLVQEYAVNERQGAFNTAFGIRHDTSRYLRLGAEHKHNWRDDRGGIMPQIWFVPHEEVTLKFGVSFPVGRNDETFGRFALELEF